MDHVLEAGKLFIEGYNCAQAVFGAFCDETGMNFEDAMKLSSSFGGGIGRMREVCGACSGMFMVAGIILGYTDPEDDNIKAEHYARVQELANKFKERFDTINCGELLKNITYDKSAIPTKRDEEFYKKRPCLKFVEAAAEIIEEMLEENKK